MLKRGNRKLQNPSFFRLVNTLSWLKSQEFYQKRYQKNHLKRAPNVESSSDAKSMEYKKEDDG